jgi:hypothetical protein
MYEVSRKHLSNLWAKAQDKSGSRQPYLDERCAAAELDDLYVLLETCEDRLDTLPAEIRSAIRRYYKNQRDFEQVWGECIEEREAKTCQRCRHFLTYDGGDTLVCLNCADTPKET